MLEKLQQFRQAIYAAFPYRQDALMNLLDALTRDGHQCKSVIELSESPAFERQYSSITDAIADGLPEVNWNDMMQLVYQYTTELQKPTIYRILLDATPNPRPFASKLEDKSITHAPNPAPGNKPICVGHQYSVLAMLPEDAAASEKHWLMPLSAKRVPSHQKANEFGMTQLTDCIETLSLQDELVVSIGDSLYSSQACRQSAAQQDNLVHISRLSANRNVFFPPDTTTDSPKAKGRKKEFGKKLNLKNVTALTPCDETTQVTWYSKKNKPYTATIRAWHTMLLRGTRAFRSAHHPMTLIQVIITDDAGNVVFKNPLWLAVMGKRRNEISLIDCYESYRARYDIEHFFRFGKTKLLMDTYQTADVNHEEYWWQLTMLAYIQLFLAKEDVTAIPKPWERYLTEYKSKDSSTKRIASPTQAQRGFKNLLEKIGSPARKPTPRGKPRGRMLGETQPIKPISSIIFKTQKANDTRKQISYKTILSDNRKTPENSKTETIEQLILLIQQQLQIMNIPVTEFAKQLQNTA